MRRALVVAEMLGMALCAKGGTLPNYKSTDFYEASRQLKKGVGLVSAEGNLGKFFVLGDFWFFVHFLLLFCNENNNT